MNLLKLIMSFNKEILLLTRPQKSKADIAVSWVYPNSYAVGMSGLGYQLVWWLLEQEKDIETFRVFTDLAESGFERSHLFGFTLSWELDFTNMLSILKSASIPLLARDRGLDDPIVFGGGPVLSANPEPFAEFFDLILLGDAEITIPNLIQGFREASKLAGRSERLRAFASTPGIYVPSLFEYELESDSGPLLEIKTIDGTIAAPAKQAFTAPADYLAHSVILAPEASWGDMFLLELVRSCPQECRFCLASYLTRPFRGANIESVLSKIKLAMKHTRKIGILGPSVTEHPQFSELAAALMEIEDLRVSIASIRMDTIDPLLLKMLCRHGQKSVTIALESGSERLRRIMKKNLSEEEIWQGMEIISKSGIEQVKFYGIAGLPGETQADLEESVRLLKALKKQYRKLRLVFGLSSFVPKAQTPFQCYGHDRKSGEKLEYLRKNLAPAGIEVRPESHNWSEVQSYLSRADRRVTPVLLELAASKGKLGDWKRAFKGQAESIPSSDFYIYRQIPEDEFLPWSHLLDQGKSLVLKRQSRQALEAMSL